MPYSNIESIPKSLKTANLTLLQANDWARYYDDAKKSGAGSAAAVAWQVFKKKYYKSGKQWRKKKATRAEKCLFNPVIKLNTIKLRKIKREDVMEEVKGYELVYRGSSKPTSLEDVDAEGKVYEKELIREGEWAHPQRASVKLKITLARMKEWVANFNKQLFKVPVPKRHSLDPEDNRGWVKKLILRKNDEGKHVLFGHLDITNDKMQKSIDTGDIQDVSVSIGDYRDNKGKKHGEALQHVALTVIPHIDSQAGFSPINAEGYMCLEEVGFEKEKKETIDNQAPSGSAEKEKEEIQDAIIIARMFPEEKNFYIVGTYETKIIAQYFGGGAGETGEPISDRYFEIPYTKDLNGNYVFGDKVELVKEYYFIEKSYVEKPTVAAEGDNNIVDSDEKNIQEEAEMKEFETLTQKHAELEKKKVDLETKVAEMEPKIVELEKAKTDLEESNKVMKGKLDTIDAEARVSFEKATDSKVAQYVEAGNILPAEQEDIKAVLLEGGKSAEVLEKTLKDRKAIDLESRTIQESKKIKNGGELTPEQIKAEADRISKGDAPIKS